jgi:hypothetical protein
MVRRKMQRRAQRQAADKLKYGKTDCRCADTLQSIRDGQGSQLLPVALCQKQHGQAQKNVYGRPYGWRDPPRDQHTGKKGKPDCIVKSLPEHHTFFTSSRAHPLHQDIQGQSAFISQDLHPTNFDIAGIRMKPTKQNDRKRKSVAPLNCVRSR